MADSESIRARLRAKVVVDLAGCWIWQGALDPSGYGAIKIDGRKVNAHRAAYEAFIGPVPTGKLVCHDCHNYPCINPEHLYAGSRAQNLQDALRAGKDCLARLTSAQVQAIRRSKMPRERIAQRYGIGLATVNKILRGETHRAV